MEELPGLERVRPVKEEHVMKLREIGIRVLIASLVVIAAAGWLSGPRSGNAQSNVGAAIAAAMKDAEVVDLTVLISEQLPAHWPTHAPFQRWTFNWFKPVKGAYGDNLNQSVFPYYGQRFVIDEHTGTQLDCPAHFIPPEGSGMPFAGPMGKMTCDKMNPAQWMGPGPSSTSARSSTRRRMARARSSPRRWCVTGSRRTGR
jgi:hypothetical protein